eukprot:178619_1
MSQQYMQEQNEFFTQLYSNKPKKHRLSEKQAKKLNYKALINGYIRSEINATCPQKNVIDLCIKYSQILDISPSNNPINYVSDQDITKCDYYKSEGNKHYKLKQYELAISKYTTALRFNPNNHLVLNNRALCHYLMKNYKDAEQDALDSITHSPTFYKAWHRYGAVLQQQGNSKFAGICYRTAYYLSIDWNLKKETKKNQYKIYYDKYMKSLEKTNEKDIIDYIHNFEIKCSQSTPEDQLTNALSGFNDKESMKEMMSKQGGMEEILMGLMQNEQYLNSQQEEKLYYLIGESKYKYFIENNMLKCDEDDMWAISFASTTEIYDNKRLFSIIVVSTVESKVIAQYTHYGVPKGNDMLKYLYRSMAFANLINVKQMKPKGLIVDWRSRVMFDEINNELKKLGIRCVQESYMESLNVCKSNNTDVNGWNHLD